MARGNCVTTSADWSTPRLAAVFLTITFSSRTVSISCVASASVPVCVTMTFAWVEETVLAEVRSAGLWPVEAARACRLTETPLSGSVAPKVSVVLKDCWFANSRPFLVSTRRRLARATVQDTLPTQSCACSATWFCASVALPPPSSII